MKIGIAGLGLIGGSLGLDFRSLGHDVFGVSRRAETCQQAIALGVADYAGTDLSLLAAAEVVFLCTPLAAIKPTVLQLLPHLSPNTVLTDVGSVKASVVAEIAPLWHNFVGGHPMAGRAESGLEAAQPNLFVGAAYVLTPISNTPTSAIACVETLVRSLQTKIYHCQPAAHDRAVALISHLPVMVSASLIATCLTEPDDAVLKLAQTLASSGFRDTSRVGGGNPELGVMMARYNREELLRSLQIYRTQLDQIATLIEQTDWAALEQQLQQTHAARPEFL
jgi:arogenate dehydrogenase (NADP+)